MIFVRQYCAQAGCVAKSRCVATSSCGDTIRNASTVVTKSEAVIVMCEFADFQLPRTPPRLLKQALILTRRETNASPDQSPLRPELEYLRLPSVRERPLFRPDRSHGTKRSHINYFRTLRAHADRALHSQSNFYPAETVFRPENSTSNKAGHYEQRSPLLPSEESYTGFESPICPSYIA
jgi:hypothetical protein